ncbi:MAG: HD domain-containing protein [Bacteroidota bacterium]
MPSRFKLFSDPVHGFVSVPKGLVLDVIETPEFQRLRRIRQLGLGHLVFPGAEHTRFGHALGAMALMQQALGVLHEKGTPLSPQEVEAAHLVALLHDIGHGPFSHTLEHDLIGDDETGTFHHETMSRALIARLDDRFEGRLGLALALFDGTYARPFFHELVASQLDVDRLDYLRRDSFFTGVAEGVVGVERIIKTMRVHPTEGGPGSRIVIEAKGAYAVESFVLSRRLMYAQVYLHKTVIAADHVLRSAFARAQVRAAAGDPAVEASAPPLWFFLANRITTAQATEPEVVDAFARLDDTGLLYSLTRWMESDDPILADLSARFLQRRLFQTRYLDAEPTEADLARWHAQAADWLVGRGVPATVAETAAPLYVTPGVSRLRAYAQAHTSICILERDGRIRELSEAPDAISVGAMAGAVSKPYVCFPKDLDLHL